MKNKRLQLVAETLCQSFSEGNLVSRYPQLRDMGSGTLGIDLLSETCTFDFKAIPNLEIVSELKSRMQAELLSYAIPVESVTTAHLTIDLNFHVSSRVATIGCEVVNDDTLSNSARCVFSCKSKLESNFSTYRSAYYDVEDCSGGLRRAS